MYTLDAIGRNYSCTKWVCICLQGFIPPSFDTYSIDLQSQGLRDLQNLASHSTNVLPGLKGKNLQGSLSMPQEMGKNYFSDHMAKQKCQESLRSANRIGKWSVKEQYTRCHKGGHIWSPNDWNTNIQADCYADILQETLMRWQFAWLKCQS